MSVVMRLVSRNSSRDSSCKSSNGGTFSDSAKQIARAAHVEGVFGKTSDIALHGHEIICAVATIAPRDLWRKRWATRRTAVRYRESPTLIVTALTTSPSLTAPDGPRCGPWAFVARMVGKRSRSFRYLTSSGSDLLKLRVFCLLADNPR